MSSARRLPSLRKALRRALPKQFVRPQAQHNMHEDVGESYYLEQYLAVLEPLLSTKQRVLDVGCQYGRFVVPLLHQGHDVVGTDIDASCLDYIRKQFPRADLRLESVVETANRTPPGGFDLVLCLELLYLLPEWETILAGLAGQARAGGHVIGSHRSHGYYMHRLLHERRYDELDLLISGNHPQLNAQSPEQLIAAYAGAGLMVEHVSPIGAFSGIAVDPFAALTNPANLSRQDRARLMKYETDSALASRFAESARYLLVVAARP